jgi:tetratricopeptide (TPR) repeat protein
LWSQTFDREMTDIFAVQDEIAGAVVDALKLKLLGSPRRHTPSVEVYDLFLRGRQSLIRANREDTKRALESFRQAVALDPAYAEAYAMLAMAEVFMAPPDPKGRAEAKQRGMAAAERAVALDPQLGDAYGSRGFLRRLEWDWAGALADAEKSVQLGPMDGRNQLRYGVILQTIGRLREGLPVLEKATELEPLLTPAWVQLGVGRGALGDFAGMRRALRRASAIDPHFLSDYSEAELLLLEGKAAQARAVYAKMDDGELGVIMADHSLGKRAEARQALDRYIGAHPDGDPYLYAEANAWLGADAKAFAWLDKAVEQRSGVIVYLNQDPLLRSLRDDPRYAAFTRKLGMPAAP